MLEQATFEQVLDYANRANPYPLYARMRQTPVARQPDGSYLVSTYREIVALLNDPRISSERHRGNGANGGDSDQERDPSRLPGFIRHDPPEHDRLRRQATWPYGPPHAPERVAGMEPEIIGLARRQIDAMRGKRRIDIVEDFAYPLPVTVICELLGVPREDEPRFHVWTEAILASTDGARDPHETQEVQRQRRDEAAQAVAELREYIAGLAERDRQRPSSDLLSGLVHDSGPDGLMALSDVVDTGMLLLFAGHETTVNLISNAMLTLLRHPDVLERLRRDPDLVIPLVEEVLRFEPPVHALMSRWALADIPIAGSTIPRGASVILLLASGNRDPTRFRDPDRFDPDRQDNQHLGFGSGIHHCYGAPLARLEAQIALNQLARRLENPRLVQDPPPYRQSATLRGPRQLLVDIDGVRD